MKKALLLSIVVSGLLFANNIESGYEDYFVIDSHGTSYSWGYNEYGDLGVGDTSSKKLPTPLDTNVTFKDISSFYSHSLAVTKDGAVYAWGDNSYGQLGDGTTRDKYYTTKVDINDTIKKVFRKYLAKGACTQASAKLLKVNGASISKLIAYSLV